MYKKEKIRKYPLSTEKNRNGLFDILFYVIIMNLLCFIFLIKSFFFKNKFIEINKYLLKHICQSKIKIKSKKRLDINADVYLVNHTTSGDFIIDPIVTNSSCSISRKLVFIVLFFTSLYCLLYNKIKFITINRESYGYVIRRCIEEKEKFLYYPEGGRNPNKEKLKLRYGGLQEIYNKKLKIQIVISYNKDKIFNEFKYEVYKNVVIYTYYSKLIDSCDYEIFDDFFNEVQKTWDEMYIIK